MGDNFQDNIVYGQSTLAVSGDAIIVGSTDNGAKSVIFNNSGSQGHLAWQPTGNETIFLPNSGGTVQLTGQVPGAVYDGANSITSGTIRFTNANGVSFSINGQTLSASVAAQTVQTVGLYALGNTTQNSSTTLDARTLSFNGLGNITVGYSNGSIQISGAGGGGGGTLSLYALGNTTQNSSTSLNITNVSYNALGAMTMGYSNGSIQVSAPATSSLSATGAVSISVNGSTISIGAPNQTAQTQSNIQAVYDGANSISTGTIIFTNANGVSFSVNGQTISGSVAAQTVQTIGLYALGNTTQNSSTTLDARTLSFNAIGGITVGFSNGSIQLSYPIINTLNDYEPEPLIATTGVNMSIGSWYFEPFIIPAYISGGRINRIIGFGAATNNMLMATSSASFSSATVGTRSIHVSYMNSLALYQLGTGTNSTRLESLWSNTFSFGLAQSVSVSTDGGSSVHVTNAATLSYIASINSAGSYTTTTLAASTNTSSASAAMACSAVTGGVSSIINMLSNIVIIPVGFNTTISAGNYWLAQAWTGGTTTAGTVGTAFTYSQNINLSAAAQGFKLWGQTTNVQLMPGAGNFTTTSASPMATVPFASIVTCATVMRNYWNYVNSTI
jgi:hypothetical protein